MSKSILKVFIFITIVLCSSYSDAQPLKKEIDQSWKFKQWRLTNWYPAKVPGVVHLDLLANKIIEDPFYRLNERGLQWIDKEDWMYETHFDVDDEMYRKDNIVLDFKGLDNYADVYLNGDKILVADNMFREWKVDVKSKVKLKDNKLEVFFHSPIKTDLPKYDALPYQYRTGPDQAENGGIFDKRISIFARKAGYQYGWDWGPRFVTTGIWRPVYLEAWNELRIDNVFFHQKEVSSKKAVITTNVEVVADDNMKDAKVLVKDNATGKIVGEVNSDLQKGANQLSVTFAINNPKLWWCNGLGDPNLYEFKTEVQHNSIVLDNDIKKIGIRSMKMISEPDEFGRNLYLELNGVRVFSKGANYVPLDNFTPRITKEKYEQTILDAVNANMNMLRVWGGGIYEDDYFYELCDKYGIMVWQDFMFACSLYPSEGKFLENIKQEAIDNVKRLRNHASIALWAGNNEAREFWIAWGWKEHYEKIGYADKVWKQYTDLFEGVLPDVIKQYSPGTYYQSSSPYSDGSHDDKNGDRHYWGVWHGHKPTTEFNVVRSRFFSEYGFQSFPEYQSIKIFAPEPSDWNITSEVMMAHQRAGSYANPLIEEYLLNEYKKPKDFQSFIYMSQVLQGDAIKTAIEAHRRDMPYCMGTLFWQHNDCWPVASWSSRDYYGRWKAQHYFSREAYRDILVSPIANENVLDVYIVSDRLSATKGNFKLKVVNLEDNSVINEVSQAVSIPANNGKKHFSTDITSLLKGADKNKVFITVSFTDKQGVEYSNRYFLVPQKEVNFPEVNITRTIKPVAGGFEVVLHSNKLARAVFLSLDGIDNFFGNNYFDIIPGNSVALKVQTSLTQSQFEKQLKIISFKDAY